MEFQENGDLNEEQNYDIEIYSRNAIWGFSIFFSTIFGGVLLMLNLRAAGYKKPALTVLLFSIAYTFACSILMTLLGLQSPLIALLFNMGGAAILTNYFFKKYFPEDDYYPKSIAAPLIVSLLICIPLAILVYTNMPKQ